MSETTFKDVAPAFAAKDFEGLIRFYEDVMGFDLRFRASVYAVLYRDDRMMLHIYPAAHENRLPVQNSAYFFVDGVDAFYDRIKDKVEVTHPIKDQEYGLRDFAFNDPEGNSIGVAERL